MATGNDAIRRNVASASEVKAWDQNILRPNERLSPTYRSWQMYCTPTTVPGILYYDPEGDADSAVCEYLQSKTETNASTLVTKGLWDKWWAIIDENGVKSTRAAPS
jgi:salicylate hydroxylase